MSPPRVLVVDDNRDLADNIAEILESEGYPTLVAHAPDEALRAARHTSFDAAILDVRLPGMDGVTLFSELRRTHPEATYLLMTAFTRDERIAEALRAGVQAVLAKPVPIDRLLLLLPHPRPDLPAVLVVEDDAGLQANLRELLGDHGYRVTSVATLSEARAALEASSPSAVIVDRRLPDGDGVALAETLCRETDLRVVVTTGHDPGATGETVRLTCGDGAEFLAKPFDVTRLLDALSRIDGRGTDRRKPG